MIYGEGMFEKNNAKITIMINTYNRLNELKECLNSIFMQTYSNYEIIIIDDNSSDGTKEYCENLLYNEKIKYFRNSENKGQAYGKKKYFSQITGKYIIFCDEDDYYIDEKFFDKAIKILEKDKKINCLCANSLINYENIGKYKYEELNFENLISTHKYLEKFQIGYNKPNSTFSSVFKRDILLKNGILDMNMINDSSIYLRSLISKGKVYLLKDIIGIYRIHDTNVTKNLKVDFILENIAEKKSIYEILKNNIKDIDFEKWYENQICFTIYYYFENSNYTSNDLKKIIKWCSKNIQKNRFKIILKILKFYFF